MRHTTLVWYAAYGSNLDADRFRCYLHGGCPPGASRTYPGVRDPADPLDDRPFRMAGRLVFAGGSPTWGGGIAFHDADAPGDVLARAYLLTGRQLVDVLEQEMRRAPGADHDLAPLLAGPAGTRSAPAATRRCGSSGRSTTGRWSPSGAPIPLGSGAPTAPYAATIARGLSSTHGLTDDPAVVDYLLACPGVAPEWTAASLAAAVAPGGAGQRHGDAREHAGLRRFLAVGARGRRAPPGRVHRRPRRRGRPRHRARRAGRR